ncbi:MAG TPA: NAD(P)-dependent alcohol dehydrogenase [Polyangiaceae bacterium]
MRVVSLAGGFGFEHLTLEERPEPSCGAREILVRVLAVSLNARDAMMVKGEYNPRQRLPLVPGSDASAEVVAVGADVSEWAVGDRVCPVFSGLWQRGRLTREIQRASLGGPLDGTLREYMVVAADAAVPAPAHWSALEAACLPCAGVTAFRALVELGQLQAGHTVVCQGSGGVSLFGLQIAKALGARVIVTSRSAAKLHRARELGADHGIDTQLTPDWAKEVRALTDGAGADHVLELGGSKSIAASVRALSLGGTLSVIGVLSGALAELDLRPILMQDLRVQGVFVGSRDTFLGLLALALRHAFRPPIARVFPLHETRAAFEYAASGQQFGKVVVTLES